MGGKSRGLISHHSSPIIRMIESTSNPTVRMLRALHSGHGRREHRAFLIEGMRLVAEAKSASWPLLAVLYDAERAGMDPELAALVAAIPDATAASSRALREAADTVTPQGIVAAAALPSMGELAAGEESLVLVMDSIADPGNAGTLLRSALGTGVRSVLTSRGSVDLFSPKVVRSGMGAHFRLKLGTELSWEHMREILSGRYVVLADARAETPYYRFDWRRPSALIVSSEAHGPGPDALQLASSRVSIPISPELESLNAAVAGSVILFEAKRQREESTGGSSAGPSPGA
jgi:RNA methyltransferase, TrmH family